MHMHEECEHPGYGGYIEHGNSTTSVHRNEELSIRTLLTDDE